MDDSSTPRPATRSQEQALIDVALSVPAGRLLCTSAGRGQFPRAFAARHPGSTVVCWSLDLYQQQQMASADLPAAVATPPTLSFVCQPDPPDETFDLAALPLSQSGEAELARDMLQSAHERLASGGSLVASTDNPGDKWLHEQMQALFPKVQRHATGQGTAYSAVKQQPLKRVRHFECEFPCRDGERLLQLRTRPGVFSHRRVDPGARALMAVMEIDPGMRVLDIGCGSGVVGIAAAARAENVEVLALDSNPRAIEATQWAAAKNNLPSVRATLDADGQTAPTAAFDLVVANPPYYSNFRIAELFVATATRALRPGGQLLVVTKEPEWYFQRLHGTFRNIEAIEIKRYMVVRAKRRAV